jgi:PLP dependent protein
MSIEQNLGEIKKNIPAGCTLVAVSKTKPIEKIKEAYAFGQRVFGENRAQELASKYPALPTDIEWHMIGHLQTNKVKYIAAFVHLIHSVDSLKILEEINRQAAKANRLVDCLLQVHIAEEETKFGFSPNEVRDALSSSTLKEMRNVNVKGLMGMATLTNDEAQIRREFRLLKRLFDDLRSQTPEAPVTMEHLSMGMSGDYRIALEEGSTMVRVGTAIFGERNRP